MKNINNLADLTDILKMQISGILSFPTRDHFTPNLDSEFRLTIYSFSFDISILFLYINYLFSLSLLLSHGQDVKRYSWCATR